MNSADILEVYKRLAERNAPFLDERAHAPHEFDKPLFLRQEVHAELSVQQ
jgi:hypothetical protein